MTTDAELLRAADARAFGELYGRHAVAVHEWFARRVAWAAADLTAETFARAWLSRRRFRNEREDSALPWLLGIGRNVLRESARQDRVETAARERLGLPLALADDDYAAVDELPYDDVARSLRIRPAAARLRVSRALRRLASVKEDL